MEPCICNTDTITLKVTVRARRKQNCHPDVRRPPVRNAESSKCITRELKNSKHDPVE